MKPCDVKTMFQHSYEDPYFFVNFRNVGRGLVGDGKNNNSFIKNSKSVNCWRILGDELEKVENSGILFDTETYIFQWVFEISENNITVEDILFFYWKGNNASKGFSPLPTEIVNQNPVVERICQWSEPALFFHMFTVPLIVFSGSHKNFNSNTKRLFMIRGELMSEIHLYEIPCSKESLRSRGTFLLINPSEEALYIWYGSAVPRKHQQLIPNLGTLNKANEYWTTYKTTEIREGIDDNRFLDSFECQDENYVKILDSSDFTPRLFYFNSITGDFLATEVEYPLRNKGLFAAFPFLQSHLYTAVQPAVFMLDNCNEIYLWVGWKTSESNLDLFEIELQLAKETTNNYAKQKNVPVKFVHAGLEPLEFINIFPFWNKKSDITEIQLRHNSEHK